MAFSAADMRVESRTVRMAAIRGDLYLLLVQGEAPYQPGYQYQVWAGVGE